MVTKLVLSIPGSAVEEETLSSGKPVGLFVSGEAAVCQFSVQVIILLEKKIDQNIEMLLLPIWFSVSPPMEEYHVVKSMQRQRSRMTIV